MRSIWKYDVEPGAFIVEMPAGAEVLSVGMQPHGPVMWALVDVNAQQMERRRFVAAGTGHALSDVTGYRHIGTFSPEPGLWFHLLQVGR